LRRGGVACAFRRGRAWSGRGTLHFGVHAGHNGDAFGDRNLFDRAVERDVLRCSQVRRGENGCAEDDDDGESRCDQRVGGNTSGAHNHTF
jgi:hypothetical protein